jgi:site-specific DNA recombinase
MRAVAYIRVSTDDQIDGYSLDKQEEECMSYIKRSGYDFVETYMDDGYSAKDMNRPALKRMLAEIPKHSFDMIVVWHTDRLTRDIIDGLTMVKTLFNKYGVKFASVTEDIDTSSYDGMMMFTMRLMMAQRERERIGERVSMALAKKASTGKRVTLGAIYGYDVVDGKLVINPTEAEWVRWIYQQYVYKSWGYGRIAKYLNDNNVPAKLTKWAASTIKGILKNITYTGKNLWNGILSQGDHELVIPDELFGMAETQLKRRGSLEMSRSSYHYPFSSIIKCGACGASYTASYTRKPEDKYGYCNYRCSNKKAGLCKEPDIAEMKFAKLFFDFFSNMVIQASSYNPSPTEDTVKQAEKEKKRIEREIAKLDNRKSNLLDDLGDKIITREDYKKKIEEINQNLTKLQQELNIIQPQEVAATLSPSEIAERIRNLEDDWIRMSNEDRKFVIQVLFKRIVISKGTEWEIKEVEPA